MTVDFKKESINLNELVKNEKSLFLAEGDIIVPDTCPDIAKVLTVSAHPFITYKEINGRKVTVSGTIRINILYLPEKKDENTPPIKAIDTEFEFSDIYECGCDSPDVIIKVNTENINCTLLNSRKLNVKVTCSASIKSYCRVMCDLPVDSPEDVDMELKKKNVSIYNVAADICHDFSFSETISVPAAKADIEELLKTDITVQKGECKFMDNRILLRGSFFISTLYLGFEDGYVTEHMEHELPFGEIVDIDIPTENCICNINYCIKEINVNIKNDPDGDPRLLDISMTVSANITSSETHDTEIIDDCFIPGKLCSAKREAKLLRKCINEGESKATAKNVFSLADEKKSVYKVMNLSADAKVTESVISDNKLTLKGNVTAFVLYFASENTDDLNSKICEIPFEHSIDIDDIAPGMLIEYNVSLPGTTYNILSDSELEIRCSLEFFTRVTDTMPVDVITDCSCSEPSENDTHMPQLTVYFVMPGDTLWDIAKRYNTTVQKIADTNNIEGDLKAGSKILIPSKR